jgi:chromosome segregation ATPase
MADTKQTIEELRIRVDAALTEVEAAEAALEGLLADLKSGPRAEKVTITAVLETAFTRLRTAREELAKLQKLSAP